MEKAVYQFEDFLAQVDPNYKDFAVLIHEAFIADGYKIKVENKKTGFFVSYSHPKTKRSVLNFLFRKKGLIVRIYADNHYKYNDFINTLPQSMELEISKASACKRLVDPEACSPNCVMGFDFQMKGNHFQKCRYGCFQFVVTDESAPFITIFTEKERVIRRGIENEI